MSQLHQLLGPLMAGGQAAATGGASLAPDAAAMAAQYGTPVASGMGAQASLAPSMDPMSIIAQSIQQQNSPTNIALQGLGSVGQNFINKNVMQKQLMPAPGAFGMTSSQMGPLQLSPLLNYLSSLGVR